MLQPLQLKDVSLRYPGEIAELRDFLGKAGFTLGTAGTLSAVAASLQRDRAFHRDLILHVWVLIDRSGGQTSPSDLLGVLAIAAAGQQFAAEASEDDAHDLLRFVMEARRSMDAPTAARAAGPQRVADVGRPAEFVPAVEPSEAPSPVVPPTSPQPPVIPTRRITSPAPPHVTAEPADLRYSDTEKSGGGKRAAWGIALALCLLALVAAGVWHYRKPPVASAPAPIVNSSPAAVSSTTAVSPERVETPQATSTAEANATEPAPARVVPKVSQEATRRSREAPVIARSVPPSAVPRASVPPPYPAGAVTSAPVVRTPSAAGTAAAPPASSATSAPTVTRTGTTRPAANPPVPAAALSSRLGSSTIPAYAALPDADATTDGRRYPRLLRRRMPLSGSNNQVAELHAPGLSGSTPAIPVGTVRPTSLGIMAGNLLYSPTPAYPAAAAAAHVQGEVKVQAEIDRDGNVVSARVVSGPPMLRDAAVDAIQHWRYKPWTSGGKTVPTSAVAVVDFQLP